MRVRIISGVVVALAVSLILLAGKEAFDIACTLLAVVAVTEIFNAFEDKGLKPLRFGGYVSCFCLLLGAIGTWNWNVWGWLRRIILFVDVRFLLYLALIIMFVLLIFRHERYTVADLSVTVMGSFYVCFLFWHLILLRSMQHGLYIVGFVILGAVATDTCAYFVGTALGRHKLVPLISPKKTVEGAIGGVAGCVLLFVAYGMLSVELANPIPIWKCIIMAVPAGIVAQLGDLAASCIKRFCGVKDFGKVIPGHGGILDRLDSVLILAPLIYTFFV